ncbi:MAG: peptide-methionine (S)-S-oxide reductase MsrA [Acidobacteria bacterium]|nr:peptide-methionine (S)-S-oxide reductase MsrA [Acidobacteriota bacterium]
MTMSRLWVSIGCVLALATASFAEQRKQEEAIFAGGCFWCMEPPFEKLDGVSQVISGYAGGIEENPTYEEVSSGTTGHRESVKIVYDPSRISYEKLLEVFWRQIDPSDAGGQFVDRGRQYRSGIFYVSDDQKRLALASRDRLAHSGKLSKPIVTEILQAGKFYRAEEYHQDFYKKDPVRYKSYRMFSGRDQFIERVWGESH